MVQGFGVVSMARQERSRLMIVAEAGAESGLSGLTAIFEAADVAALVITSQADGRNAAASARPLVELAQAKGAAALVEADAQLARSLRADGVHLPWSKDTMGGYREARHVLGSRFIVGVDAGRSRHDAMSLGEAGVDYVGFGIPSHVEDRETAVARRLTLIEWWSEIFEVPCVAFDVEAAQEAAALSHAGADFVALRVPVGRSSADLSGWAKELADLVETPENVS